MSDAVVEVPVAETEAKKEEPIVTKESKEVVECGSGDGPVAAEDAPKSNDESTPAPAEDEFDVKPDCPPAEGSSMKRTAEELSQSSQEVEPKKVKVDDKGEGEEPEEEEAESTV